MAEKRPVLRWRQREKETGLASINNRSDEFDLWYGEDHLGSVAPVFDNPFNRHSGQVIGYYWAVGTYPEFGITHKNTAHAPLPTLEEAKSAARAYVEQCLVNKGLRKK